MKVLWVTNTMFPDLAKDLGLKPPVVGGWMYGLARDLANSGKVKLYVATARDAKLDESREINGITYFLLKGNSPINKYDKTLEPKWKKIIDLVNPDVVHIHGSEYAHGLSLINACPPLKYVISIQGLVSICARYYLAGLGVKDIIWNTTLKDFLKRSTLWHETKEFYERGKKIEVNYLKKVNHIIGRTQWDHDHAKIVNPDCTYHFCNESLRDSFYDSEVWEPKPVSQPPTIFLSQASRPLKGLHKVLEAVHLLKDLHPNIQLRIAGGNIFDAKGLKQRLKMSSYGNYIRKKVKKYDLWNRITFTGPLNEKEMVTEYLNCHMFICPSSIENSPNSLGEAQILGVPVISSFVGGVADMVTHNQTGLLYRFEEVEMLAREIHQILTDPDLVSRLSKQGKEAAMIRHDRKTNLNQLISIYSNCTTK